MKKGLTFYCCIFNIRHVNTWHAYDLAKLTLIDIVDHTYNVVNKRLIYKVKFFKFRSNVSIFNVALFNGRTVLWRPKNFSRHYLDIHIKCK
jgi:hypothetical protein